ncbi:MAG: HEAT repeat domain-containing protein [Phycisphaeraceae bacterium]
MGLDAGSAAGLSRVVSEQVSQVDELENEVCEYNSELIKRMELDFALLKHPKVTDRLGEKRAEKIWREIDALVPAGQALANIQESADNLRVSANVLAMALHLIVQGVISPSLVDKLRQTAKDTSGEIKDILRILGKQQYPFSHGDGKVTMAQAICEKPPAEDNFADIYYVAEDMSARLVDLRERIIGRLCHHAERVEKVMGLARLPEPDEPDALDELLEKIGVDDSTPVQEETHSTKGLVGALMFQGVMGVAVLFLSGFGVYALLPSEPASIAKENRPAQVAQSDQSPPRDARSTPPDRTRPTNETTRPTRPTVTPDRVLPVPRETPPPTIDEAIRFVAWPNEEQQEAGLAVLLNEGTRLSLAQKSSAAESAIAVVTRGQSPHMRDALELLSRCTPDQGLHKIGEAMDRRRFYVHPLVIEHVTRIDEFRAAQLLIRIGMTANRTQAVADAMEREPMSKYAEDALVELLQQRDRMSGTGRRQAVMLLVPIATEKSIDLLTELADDRDSGVKNGAEQALARVDPTHNDPPAKFLRLINTNASSSQTARAMFALADTEPEEDDERQADVCQAVLKWMERNNRGLDTATLRVLANWGDASVVPMYMDLLKDERANRTTLAAAMRLAGQQADDEQAKNVAKAIGNWYLLETDAVTDSLIALGAHGEAPAIQHLSSKHAKVRLGCIEVLLEVGSVKALGALQKRGSDSDPEVRETARSAFYELRDKLKKEEQ